MRPPPRYPAGQASEQRARRAPPHLANGLPCTGSWSRLRGSADRFRLGRPAVSPVDELGGEQECDGESERGFASGPVAVGVAAELTEVRQSRVRAFNRPSQTHGLVWCRRVLRCAPGAFLGDDRVVESACGEPVTSGSGVVTAVQPDRLDIAEEAERVGRIQGRGEQYGVVAVRSVERPTERDAAQVGQDRPLVAELAAIGRVRARSLAPAGLLCWEPSTATSLRSNSMMRSYAAIASRASRSNTPAVIHSSPAGPHGGVRHLVAAEPFGVFPRAPGREAYQDHLETQPVIDTGSVTAQRVGPGRGRDQTFDRCPDNIADFGVQRAHDGG